MQKQKLEALLREYKLDKAQIEAILSAASEPQMVNLGFANLDMSRASRQGFPEVIFGPGKTAEQIIDIAQTLFDAGQPILATRISAQQQTVVNAALPTLHFDAAASCLHSDPPQPDPDLTHQICIISGGTGDLTVLSEARLTLRMFGIEALAIADIGVAGIHRLDAYWPQINAASVLIVIAGMEGALPSVVAGLSDKPVIAVPTSVGYGSNLEGITTLLAMLSSCANGISVVNIDNGFGAAFSAALMLRQLKRFHENREKKRR